MKHLYKVFQSYSGDVYAYDALTGMILTVKPPLIKETFSQTERATLEHLDKTKKDARSSFDRLVWEKDFDGYLAFIDKNIPGLLLQMTTRCNLNCDYCVYSENYRHMENHGSRDMDQETILKSIDFYFDHSEGCREAEISFYGGETLLCFRQMKEAVPYAREKFAGKKLVFKITTNGMLLNREVSKWLNDNPDVVTTVTLNGPFHDQHRKTVSGEGSLSFIMDNLKAIKSEYPDLWQDRIHFIANITKVKELHALRDFYQNEVGKAPAIITHIRSQDGNEFIQNMIYERDHDREKANFSADYVQNRDSFLNAYFGNAMNAMENRLIKKNDGVGIIGSCLPFTEKMYVHADGKFGICETACDKLIIGDLESGFDKAVLKEIYQKAYDLFNASCRQCWAKNLCTVCFKDILDTDGGFLSEIPKPFCISSRKYALEQLKTYCDFKKMMKD